MFAPICSSLSISFVILFRTNGKCRIGILSNFYRLQFSMIYFCFHELFLIWRNDVQNFYWYLILLYRSFNTAENLHSINTCTYNYILLSSYHTNVISLIPTSYLHENRPSSDCDWNLNKSVLQWLVIINDKSRNVRYALQNVSDARIFIHFIHRPLFGIFNLNVYKNVHFLVPRVWVCQYIL